MKGHDAMTSSFPKSPGTPQSPNAPCAATTKRLRASRLLAFPPVGVVLALAATLAACSSTVSGGTARGRAVASGPPRTPAGTLARCRRYEPLLRRAAASNGVDPALVMGVAWVESRFRQPARSRVGAGGLMQIMPATARGLRCGDVRTDATANATCGARLLRRLLARFDGNEVYALAAYHAGPAPTRRALRADELPRNFGYADAVLAARGRYLRGGCAALVRP